MSRRLVAAATAAALAAACKPPQQTAIPEPPVVNDPVGPHADAIAAQVQPYVDAEIVTGLVVGVVDGERVEIYGFGRRTPDKPDRPDGRTIFELGTVTQVFTSILLADAVSRGEVEYDTPVSRLVPMGVTVPTTDDQAITLEMLATHRSGLPTMPRSLAGRELDPDPYAGYGADQLWGDLVAGHLDAVPGKIVRYAVWGTGLLGFTLARKVGAPYGDLFVDRIAKPLGLVDTRLDVPASASARDAAGHNVDLAPASPWHADAMAGAVGLHTTARDMTALLRAELAAAHGGKGPLADRLRATQEVRIPADPLSVGLGWWIEGDGRHWLNGGSSGYHAFIAFDAAKGQGVVVLAATSTSLVDRLGGALLDVVAGKTTAPAAFPDPKEFAKLTGRYRVGDAEASVVVRGKRVYLIEPGQAPTRLLPLSATEFFVEQIQAPIAFQLENDKAVGLVIFVGGKRLEGQRISDLPPDAAEPAPPAPPAPAPTGKAPAAAPPRP